MPKDVAKKLMNKANPKDTGNMHGMPSLHLGNRVRLLEASSINQSLMKDAEGIVVHITVHPEDQDRVDQAMLMGAGTVYLRRLPLGIWVRMDKYSRAPFSERLQEHDNGLLPSHTNSLVFVAPRTSDPFVFRECTLTRTGFPLSHARVGT